MTDAGFLSLLPVLVTLGIAVWTRNVVLGLFVGVFTGVLLLNGVNPFTGVSILVEDYLVAQASKSANMGIIILMIFIAGLVGLMEKSGGAAAFAAMIIKYITARLKHKWGRGPVGVCCFSPIPAHRLLSGRCFALSLTGLKSRGRNWPGL